MAAYVVDYQNLIISEHNQQPEFIEWVAAGCQPYVDLQNLCFTFSQLFDIDIAIGDQLDKLGRIIGQSRSIPIPLVGVYFSFGDASVGFGFGTWQSPSDPTSGLTILPDDAYRTLLKAVIARNYWDGTIPGAYAVWAAVFADVGGQVYIVDFQDMTMALIFSLPNVTAVIAALITNGFLDMRPAGVRVVGYYQPSVPGQPIFGFGVQNSTIAGFGTGVWLQTLNLSSVVGGSLVSQPSIANGSLVTTRLY